MKLFIALTILFLSANSYAQNETVVSAIRNVVERINKDSGYTTKMLDGEEFLDHATDRGATLTGYFKNSQLVKIVEWIGLSSCVNITEYYFQDNKLIFTYTQGKEFQFIDSLGEFGDKQTLTMECRFYFDNGQLIKSLLKGSTRCGGEPQQSWAADRKADALKYVKLLSRK